MKKYIYIILGLAFILLIAGIAFPTASKVEADDPHYLTQVQNPEWRHNNSPFSGAATLVYDPVGVTVSSTTIPIVIASTTVLLTLKTVSSSIVLGLVAANVQTQLFIQQNGCMILAFPVQSSTAFTGCTNTNFVNPWTVNLDPIITATGNYPFIITLLLQDQKAVATGTIIAQ